jgi:hypothetical protein
MPKLIQPQLREAEFKRTIWTATPQAGTTQDEITKPEFWVHVAGKLKIGDRIEVSPESGEWLADVIVRATGDGGPVVHVLHFHAFTAYSGIDTKNSEPVLITVASAPTSLGAGVTTVAMR